MKKTLTAIPAFILLTLGCLAQNNFIKVLGRDSLDAYTDMEETNDGGIVFGGRYQGVYSFTRCNSNADTLFTNQQQLISGVGFNSFCVLEGGNYALAGTNSNGGDEQAVVLQIDSAFNFGNAQYFNIDDGWGMYGFDVFPMPDSGVLLTAYGDGYTCSNTVSFFNLDQNLQSVWTKVVGVCDADLSYSPGFNNTTQLMNFLRVRYYESDTAGNWYEDVPQIITIDGANNQKFDSLYFINKVFTGIIGTSDSDVLVFGYHDSLGSRESYLMKIDKSGAIEWTNSFGTIYNDYPINVVETDDHGFAVLASQLLPNSNTGIDLTFYKLDSLGNFELSNNYGSWGNETPVKMIKKRDGSILILGRTNGFGSKVNMIIHLDSTGHLNSTYSINSTSSHNCNGDSIVLTVSPLAASYLWSTGDTTSSIIVTTSGNYDLTVSDFLGQPHVVPVQPIYFDSPPDATMQTPSTISLCGSQPVTLSVPAGTSNTYQWFSDSVEIVTAHFNSYTVNSTGNYRVIVSNACGADTSTVVNVIWNPNPPQPQVTVNPGAQQCFPDSTILTTNLSGYTIHWKWSTNDVTGDTLILKQPGQYGLFVRAIDPNGCMSPDKYVNVVIDSMPSVSFNDSLTNFCMPGTMRLMYSPSASFGNFTCFRNDTLLFSTQTAANFYANSSGVYTLVMSNGCGSDTATTVVHANAAPVANLFPDVRKICSGQPVLVTCPTQGLYTWYPMNDPSQVSNTSFYLISTPGDYRFELIDPLTGCSTIETINAQSTTDPVPVLNSLSDTTLCPGRTITLDPGVFESYMWSNGDTSQTLMFTNPGATDTNQVSVIVVDSHDCTTTDSVLIIFDICASVSTLSSPGDLNVYPNPSSDKITFELNATAKSGTVFNLYAIDGRLVSKEKFIGNSLFIHSNDYPSDTYIYVIENGDERMRGIINFIK